MKWWNKLWRSPATSPLWNIRLSLPGWKEESPSGEMRVWRDEYGNVLSLAVTSDSFSDTERADETAVRNWCRNLARIRSAGLIEASTASHGVRLIYKRLQMPAYIYTGMLFVTFRSDWLVWTVVAGEHGTTGVREAVVTARLLGEGKLAIEDYETRWAADPYDPDYARVDRSVLRSMADDQNYDDEFPEHPLTKVRSLLRDLPSHVTYDS